MNWLLIILIVIYINVWLKSSSIPLIKPTIESIVVSNGWIWLRLLYVYTEHV